MNAPSWRTRFDLSAPRPTAAELGRVHLLAVGGAGMSAVARLLVGAGVPTSGSDAKDSETLRALAASGVRVWVGHEARHVADVDTVVVSSAIREDNVELVAARAAGCRILHRSQALAALMAGRRGVAVAGANGKTTTTSMLAETLRAAGADPSYAIGGDLVSTGTNAAWGSGEAFVVEADESDGSFLVYHPSVAIVTNVQPDHLDFYGTFAAVQDAYAAFVATITPGGLLVTCADDPGARRLAARSRAAGGRVVTYGSAPDADLRITDVELSGLHGRARLVGADGEHGLEVPAPGRHNIDNAAAAYLAATTGLGLAPEAALGGLATYRGALRRFEAKGQAGGVRVVDDYAHNPGKVAAVVTTAARLAPPGRLIVCFQPHLYSRTRDFADEFGRALVPADVTLVMDVYAAREDPVPGVSGQLVVEAVRRADPRAQVHFEPVESAVAPRLAALARPGDLVLTVGAGDVTQVGPLVLRLLREGV